MGMLRRLFGKVTAASLAKDLISDAEREHEDAKRQLVLARDNLFAAEAAIRYTKARVASLKADSAALDETPLAIAGVNPADIATY